MRVLCTTRLTLEPQVPDHAEAMFAVMSDPAIYEFENEPPPSVDWLRQRYARLETRRSADGSEWWLNWVIRTAPSQLIGYVQATVHPDGRAGVAYELASRYWHQGYAREAVDAMIAELASAYGVRHLSAVLKRRNHRSLRFLERLGFTHSTQGEVEADEWLMVRPIAIDTRSGGGVGSDGGSSGTADSRP